MKRPGPKEIDRLAEHWGELKKRLVNFAVSKFRNEILKRLRQTSKSSGRPDMSDLMTATDEFLYSYRLSDGRHLLEYFVEANSDLSDEDAELVLGWKRSIYSVFQLGEVEGRFVDATNLVNDLPYRLFATINTENIRQVMSSRSYLLSRAAPVGDLWMLSGGQQVYPKEARLLALGLAGRLARIDPNQFFLNPLNRERGRERDRIEHERFVEQFGGAWFVGDSYVVEEKWLDFLVQKAENEEAAEAIRGEVTMHPDFRDAETVGLISDPEQGFLFLREFGRFLSALHDPKLVRTRPVQDLLMGYLRSEDSVTPAIFSIMAKHRPKQLDAIMAELLQRPSFSWAIDGEELLRQVNPGFSEAPQNPTMILLNEDLVEGLRYIESRGTKNESGGDDPIQLVAPRSKPSRSKTPQSRISGSRGSRRKAANKRKRTRKRKR